MASSSSLIATVLIVFACVAMAEDVKLPEAGMDGRKLMAASKKPAAPRM